MLDSNTAVVFPTIFQDSNNQDVFASKHEMGKFSTVNTSYVIAFNFYFDLFHASPGGTGPLQGNGLEPAGLCPGSTLL